MQQFDDFVKAVENVGTATSELKAKAQLLKDAVDAKLAEVGQQVAADTAKVTQ